MQYLRNQIYHTRCYIPPTVYACRRAHFCQHCKKICFRNYYFFNHGCNVGEIFKKIKGKMEITTSTVQFKVFALALQHPKTKQKVWWIGKDSHYPNVQQMIKLVVQRATRSFEKGCETEDELSEGCTSLIELIFAEEPWVVLPDQSFFFELPGGQYGTIDSLKNLLRRALETPGHHCSINCVKKFRSQINYIINNILKIKTLPEKHRAAAIKFHKSVITG